MDAERLRSALRGEPAIFEAARFEFAAALSAHAREIHAEYLGVQDALIDWFERDLYGEGWKVYGLFDFPRGLPIAENIARCPKTAALIERHIPRHGAAGFSVLKAGTRIKPHTGYAGPFLRCHLGLRVPEGDCAIRVAGDTRRWREGEVLVLDDRLEHEAWNATGEDRVILLVDFIPAEDGA